MFLGLRPLVPTPLPTSFSVNVIRRLESSITSVFLGECVSSWNLFAAPYRRLDDARCWRSLTVHTHVDAGAHLHPLDEEQVGQGRQKERGREGEEQAARSVCTAHMRIYKVKISSSAHTPSKPPRSAGETVHAIPQRSDAWQCRAAPQSGCSSVEHKSAYYCFCEHLKWCDLGVSTSGERSTSALSAISQRTLKNGNKWSERGQIIHFARDGKALSVAGQPETPPQCPLRPADTTSPHFK